MVFQTYFKEIKLSEQERRKKDKEWHRLICERFDYTCVICGRKFPANMVCGHHVKSKGAFPELRWDSKNGVCVCNSPPFFCHSKIHTGEITLKNYV